MSIEWHTVTTVHEAQALSLAERRTLHVSSDERSTLAVLAAIGADVRYLWLGVCNTAVVHGLRHCSSLLSLRLDNATDDGVHGLERIPTLEELQFNRCSAPHSTRSANDTRSGSVSFAALPNDSTSPCRRQVW
jgi:hypothetical protein